MFARLNILGGGCDRSYGIVMNLDPDFSIHGWHTCMACMRIIMEMSMCSIIEVAKNGRKKEKKSKN